MTDLFEDFGGYAMEGALALILGVLCVVLLPIMLPLALLGWLVNKWKPGIWEWSDKDAPFDG